ncbi:MAG: hypothetical protein ABIB71_00235 [Candidatus Woesearchaeota archaeon]
MFDALKDTIQLVKNTFAVLGKNPQALKPTWTQIWIGAVFYSLIVLSILAIIIYPPFLLIGVPIIILSVLFFLFIFPFLKMKYRAAQCWIVYHSFTGNKISYKDGVKRAKQNKWDIIVLTIFDIVLTALAKRLKAGSGRKGILGSILNIVMLVLGKAVEEGWDLIGHYLLPASIIQEKSVTEALPEIKNIKDNVPGALAGVFAMDFAGDMIRSYFIFLGIVLFLLGAAAYFLLQTWIPLVVILVIFIGIDMLIKMLVEMVKTVYFTLFYISVTMPMKIVPEYQEEVTHYLLHKDIPAENTAPKTPQNQQYVNQILPNVRQYRSQGYTDEQISSFLAQKGWPLDVIQEALKRA